MVAPAGVADVDRRARAVQGDELGRNAQRAGAGERLHDGDAPPADERRGGAEDDLRGLLQEGLQALRRRAGAPDAASDDGRVLGGVSESKRGRCAGSELRLRFGS